ncbi:MAG: fibronectin type III domain-containing protein [Gulosibacter sp.]|uniref:fibronectin type III domain-containing protein n=1 Tax=Gulosibacter sp. TaxID=2817531 RepID=UPI003F918953
MPRSRITLVVAVVVAVSIVGGYFVHATFFQDARAPISKLVLSPGADATELGLNWFTNANLPEQVQIVPIETLPVETATSQTASSRAEVAGEPSTPTSGAIPADYAFPESAAATFAAAMTPLEGELAQAGLWDSAFSAKATVTGLVPGTSYAYRVGAAESGWSPVYRYTVPDETEGFSFLFYGDAQLGSRSIPEFLRDVGLERDTEGWQASLATSLETYPDASFMLSLGDQINGESVTTQPDDVALAAQYEAYFEPEALREHPLAVVPGNHDIRVEGHDAHWHMPNVSEDRHYWFTRGGMLFIGLDSNIDTGGTVSEEQAAAQIAELTEYLREVVDAQGKDADWIVVAMHQSPFGQGLHYGDGDVTALRENFAAELSAAGVDLVLGGHDHIYTRTHLMEGNVPVVPEEPAAPRDTLVPESGHTLYVTANSASGSKFNRFRDSTGIDNRDHVDYDLMHPSTAVWQQDYTADFGAIEVTETALTVTVLNTVDASLVDEVTLLRSPVDA